MSDIDERLNIVKKNIKSYKDFPKKGIIFRDIFSLFRNVEASKALFELIFEHCDMFNNKVNAIIGLESRGFLLGPIISQHLSLPFIPVRKKGKLPGETAKAEYILEYGSDIFEIQKESLEPGQSVLIVDDLLATGGSLSATCTLMESLNVKVLECFVIMELIDLQGRDKLKYPVHSLVQF